jgi:branched-chain amino acid aminotransferase
MTKFAYFGGQIVPFEEATISILNNTFHYGTGCFGGIRGYWNEEHQQLYVFRIEDHYRRFLDSANILYCNWDYTPQQLAAITVDLLSREGWRENCYIRPIAYKDAGVFQVWLHDTDDALAITSIPIGKYIAADKGAKVCVSSWRRVDDTAIPARGKLNGAYMNSALVKSEAMLNGFDEAIVLNQDGHVAEGSAANFMMVRDGVLITPPITSNILEGVTRRTMIHLAREELGLTVIERDIDRSELYIADEAFFCGTGVQIAAIASVDHRQMGAGCPGPITTQLRDLYFNVVTGMNSKYSDWLTPIPQPQVA